MSKPASRCARIGTRSILSFSLTYDEGYLRYLRGKGAKVHIHDELILSMERRRSHGHATSCKGNP